MWQKYKEWLAVLILVSMLVVCTTWYLLLNQQQIPVFLTATIVALGFVGTMILLPKYRQRLVKAAYAFHTKGQEKGGWCYRFRYIALLTIIFSALALTQYQLVPPQYSTVFVIVFLMLNTVSVSILAVGFWRVIGKWVLLLIVVALAVGILRALMRILMQT